MEFLMKISVLLFGCLSFISACGETYTDRIGVLTSPDYGRQYPTNSDCNWTISTSEGTSLVLTFLDFDVRCSGDYIEVTDLSNNTTLPGLEKKCNPLLPQNMFTVSNRIQIRFVSDDRQNARGFKLAWRVKRKLTWYSDFVSFPEAQAICKRNGGTLIDNSAEYEEDIIEAMQERHVTSIWLGKYITPWVWIKGCFNFDDLDEFQTSVRLKENQMTECMKHCSRWSYFGLQREKCFCFDTFGGVPVVTDNDCTTTCPGNLSERCGGNSSLTIYMNDICFKNSSLWQGNVSRTRSGNTCLPWGNITAITVNSTLAFPDGSAQNASNYCRNPNGSEALRCYVSQDKTELCDIPPCIDKDQQYHAVNNRLTWKQHRENFWQNDPSQCRTLVGPSIFLVDSNILNKDYAYWIGYFRSDTMATETGLEEKYKECYTYSNKDGNQGEEVTDCSSKRNFICQSVPVTCGGHFDISSNHSFSTPNYPNGYGVLLHCVWYITVPVDHYMTWSVNVDIENSPSCQNDYLSIYYGSSINGLPNSTLCGRFNKTFYNTQTNVTLEFQSDHSENSSGILVTWSIEPITTSTATTSSTSPQQDLYIQDKTEHILGLSYGAFAGLIAGVIFLLVLSCIGGFLCGKRRRATPIKDNQPANSKDAKTEKNNVNDRLDKLNSGPMDKSFTNAGFEESASDKVSKEDGKFLNDEGVDIETDSSLAIYSKVNKPTNDTCSAQNTLSPESKLSDKPDNESNELYNTLNEKNENTAKSAVNIYNHLNEADPTYANTNMPGKNNRNKVASDLDVYDHKEKK
ncbi:uncharacterized protein LOC123528640 isoform X2 [Mercenaria mercenaria]|uniref:uncharacterized protein LOC123528640 isoform X2 n=1 Tax=Mercenaria mercenaria TaxID=6596 RepID=UPI00234F010D|nr:uncharacterized protein LOC123528640 isoform X2 [Mercenaria mercenaria]